MRTWESLANERADLLLSEAERLARTNGSSELAQAKGELKEIQQRVAPSDQTRHERNDGWVTGLEDWWSGTRAEDVWLHLHRIEEEIEESRHDTGEVILHARTHVAGDAKATKQLNDDLSGATDDTAKRSVAIHAMRSSHQKSHQKHIDERQRHRAMLVFAGGLVLAAVITWGLQVYKFDASPFLVLPKDASGVTVAIGGGSLVFLVMLFGAIGGAFSGLTSLYLTAKTVDDTMWFDPRPMLAAVKIAMGIWTGFFGVLMVGTGLVVGVYTSVPSAIILAFLFGYGQQAVTGVLLDRHVGKLTKDTST